ncbi:MAG: hypothetical protein LH470_11145 [Lysobacter sp.]|nr:hypothetical protein [Lysobacter sp.]
MLIISAKAGTHAGKPAEEQFSISENVRAWVPAFAGMTSEALAFSARAILLVPA